MFEVRGGGKESRFLASLGMTSIFDGEYFRNDERFGVTNVFGGNGG
jgi:hypothetical protein